jgi:hypothetical protein
MKRMTSIFSGLSMMVFCSVSLAVELTYERSLTCEGRGKDGKKVIEFGNDAVSYDQATDKISLGMGHPGHPEGPIDVREVVEKTGRR